MYTCQRRWQKTSAGEHFLHTRIGIKTGKDDLKWSDIKIYESNNGRTHVVISLLKTESGAWEVSEQNRQHEKTVKRRPLEKRPG